MEITGKKEVDILYHESSQFFEFHEICIEIIPDFRTQWGIMLAFEHKRFFVRHGRITDRIVPVESRLLHCLFDLPDSRYPMQTPELAHHFLHKQNNELLGHGTAESCRIYSGKQVKIDIISRSVNNDIPHFEIPIQFPYGIPITSSKISHYIIPVLLEIPVFLYEIRDGSDSEDFRYLPDAPIHLPIQLMIQQQPSFPIDSIDPFRHYPIVLRIQVIRHDEIHPTGNRFHKAFRRLDIRYMRDRHRISEYGTDPMVR